MKRLHLPFVRAYLDDFIILSNSQDEHKQHLEQLFKRLEQYSIVINLEKCQFFKQTIDFLGHRLSPEGIEPTR